MEKIGWKISPKFGKAKIFFILVTTDKKCHAKSFCFFKKYEELLITFSEKVLALVVEGLKDKNRHLLAASHVCFWNYGLWGLNQRETLGEREKVGEGGERERGGGGDRKIERWKDREKFQSNHCTTYTRMPNWHLLNTVRKSNFSS